jgi:hypothetical protein
MKKAVLLLVFALGLFLLSYAQKNAKPVISSHNFEGSADLWESIGKGIFNYQADVMYIYGKIFVTPLMPDSAGHQLPTLTDAYLYPLYNQFKKNNGEIIPGYSGDIFLILNLTSQPVQVYKQLANEMRPFMDMLTYKNADSEHRGKLRILIKDKEQLQTINNIKPGFWGIVGNLSDVDKNADSDQMPLIEIDFNEITNWKGTGNIPFEDYVKIKDMVAKIHAQNKKISLINCPSYQQVADLIKTAKVDFLSTPDAIKMAGFFDADK